MSALVIIFLGAVALDILHTRLIRAIAERHLALSAALSGMITFLAVTIWTFVLQRADELGIAGALALALGASVGTLLGFYTRR